MGVFRAGFLFAPLMAQVLLINMIQILTMPLSLFSRRLVVRINGALAFYSWAAWQYVLEELSEVKPVFSGDNIPEGESAIVISNHASFTDFMLLHALALRKNMLANCKYFAKDSLKWLPGFGWGIWMMGHILLKRDWQKDQQSILETFADIKNTKLPIWLVSFVEGSRITTKKLKSSQEFAKSRNLPVLEHVLLPRVKGFIATVNSLRDSQITHVYEVTLGYSNKDNGDGSSVNAHPLTLLDVFLKNHHGRRLFVHVRRYALKDLPKDEEGLTQWCYDRYKEKDDLLKNLKATGSFAGKDKERYEKAPFNRTLMQLSMAIPPVVWAIILAKFFHRF